MEQEVALAEVAAPVLEGDDGVRVLVEHLLRVVAHVRVALGDRQRLDDVLEGALVALALAAVVVQPNLLEEVRAPRGRLDIEGARVQAVGVLVRVRVRGTGGVSVSVRVRVRVRLWLGFDLGHVQVEGGVEELVGVALEVHEEGVQVDPVQPFVLAQQLAQQHHLVPACRAPVLQVLRDHQLEAVLGGVLALVLHLVRVRIKG